jgi:hypothetical protein
MILFHTTNYVPYLMLLAFLPTERNHCSVAEFKELTIYTSGYWSTSSRFNFSTLI